MAGKGGGAWKVAYADFVTAMMAFFMVMWLTSQNDKLKEAVAEHFRQPPSLFDLGAGNAAHGGKGKPHHTAAKPSRFVPAPIDLEDTPRSNIPRVLKIHDGDDRHVGTILGFEEESAELNETAREQLKQISPLLAGKPQKIEIRGHASRRPLPPDHAYRDPWQISYARCMAVMQFLEEEGISRERMRLSQAGPSEPYTIMPDPKHGAYDSRVEIFLLSELADELVGTRLERAKRYLTPDSAHHSIQPKTAQETVHP
jgi:chemotaxis protein MotB